MFRKLLTCFLMGPGQTVMCLHLYLTISDRKCHHKVLSVFFGDRPRPRPHSTFFVTNNYNTLTYTEKKEN